MKQINRWQACLLQVVAFIALSWIFLYLVPMNWFITFYLPWSFWLLVFVALLGIVGLGWPFAPPMGIWKPGMSLAIPGMRDECAVDNFRFANAFCRNQGVASGSNLSGRIMDGTSLFPSVLPGGFAAESILRLFATAERTCFLPP